MFIYYRYKSVVTNLITVQFIILHRASNWFTLCFVAHPPYRKTFHINVIVDLMGFVFYTDDDGLLRI